jgi:hypothetical protein
MSGMSSAEMMLMTEKVDMLVSRLDDIESRMGSMQGNASSSEIDELRATVKSLEAKIGSMKSTPAIKSSTKKMSTSSAKNTVKRTSKPKVTKVSTAKDWELRGAAPGMAYVAKRGKDDVVQISVGETLSGVGKIKRIEFVNNLWVVEGTQGRISQ